MSISQLIMVGYFCNIIVPLVLPLGIGVYIFDYTYRSDFFHNQFSLETLTLSMMCILFLLFILYLLSSHRLRVIWRHWAFKKTDNIYLLFEKSLNHGFIVPNNKKEKIGLYGIQTKAEKKQWEVMATTLNEGYIKGDRNADKIFNLGEPITIHYNFFNYSFLLGIGLFLIFPLILEYYNNVPMSLSSIIFIILLNIMVIVINLVYWLWSESNAFIISSEGIQQKDQSIISWSTMSMIHISVDFIIQNTILGRRKVRETVLVFIASGTMHKIPVSGVSVGLYTLQRLLTQYSGMKVGNQ